MPSFANALIFHLESVSANPSKCTSNQQMPLVILGGGIDLYIPDNNPYEVLQVDSLVRTLRAPEFVSADTHIYVLGGGNKNRSLAAAMKQVLIDRGIKPSNITTENRSTSTFENAKAFVRLLPPSDSPSINLLTSKLHVKRASATFEKAGYLVCHIGVGTRYSIPKPPVSLLPYITGLNKTSAALREWAALTVYRLKGYI